jgi:hypothetical protein
MCSSKGQSTNAPLPIGTQIITAVPSENKSGSSIGIALGGVAVGIAIIAVIGYFVLQQKLSSRSLPIEGQPIDTPSSVSTPYIVPMASVRPISTSVVGSVRPAVSYKDQARDHADAVALPLAMAVQTRSDQAHPTKVEPPGTRHDDEPMDDNNS